MPRILIVDDDPDVLMLLRAVLTLDGHVVDMARDGADALARVQANTPDLVIMDLLMPEMDGDMALHALRGHPSTRETPVVMLTGRDDAPSVALAATEGADAYVTKPFEPETVLALVRRLTEAPLAVTA
jgi:CheY-like chemotaxis protein